MEQDLTDVLCTAGKKSAVLLLFPFHFLSPMSPSNSPLLISLSLCSPSTAPLSRFLSHSVPFSSPRMSPPISASSIFPSVCSPPIAHLPLSSFHCSLSLLPLSPSKVSIFYFSFSVCYLPTSPLCLHPPAAIPFLFVRSSLYPRPFHSPQFSLSVCSLPLL